MRHVSRWWPAAFSLFLLVYLLITHEVRRESRAEPPGLTAYEQDRLKEFIVVDLDRGQTTLVAAAGRFQALANLSSSRPSHSELPYAGVEEETVWDVIDRAAEHPSVSDDAQREEILCRLMMEKAYRDEHRRKWEESRLKMPIADFVP